MATTVYTVQDAVKLALNDASAGLGQPGTWLSDANIDGFLMDRVITSGTFTLTRWSSTAAWFGNSGYDNHCALYFDNQSTPFAAEGTETYDIYARGLKVKLKTGTRTANTISIAGTLIDFDRAMADIFWYLYCQKGSEGSISVNGASRDSEAAKSVLLAQHEYWKGVITSVG